MIWWIIGGWAATVCIFLRLFHLGVQRGKRQQRDERNK